MKPNLGLGLVDIVVGKYESEAAKKDGGWTWAAQQFSLG